MWQGWISLILGAWLFISGLIPSLQTPVNYIIAGILAAIFGFWAYRTWQGIVNGILGLWMVLSGLVSSLMLNWNLIIVGIVMAALGIWTGLSHPIQHMTTKTA